LKLRITIDGKAYEAEVEILDDAESAPEYPPYPPGPPAYIAADIPEPIIAAQTGEVAANDKECRSPVTGMVIKVQIEPGQAVQPNDVVMVLESMKMEMQVTAPLAAVVKNVLVTVGSSVKPNQLLVEFE
jgi:methylmalonyl-CoA carboxyltransferase small subunit